MGNATENKEWAEEFQKIAQERKAREVKHRLSPLLPDKTQSFLSQMFFVVGGICLLLAPLMEELTLFQATCLFVIGYVIRPNPLFFFVEEIETVTCDMGNMRLELSVLRRYLEKILSKKGKESYEDDYEYDEE